MFSDVLVGPVGYPSWLSIGKNWFIVGLFVVLLSRYNFSWFSPGRGFQDLFFVAALLTTLGIAVESAWMMWRIPRFKHRLFQRAAHLSEA